MTCCFFGHRDAPDSIASHLEQILRQMIEANNITQFLVGHQGNFDRVVTRVLAKLQKEYPQIRCYIVLYRLPTKSSVEYPLETLYPEEIATVPPLFGIDRRNRWMLGCSDMIVAYIKSELGHASTYLRVAKKQGKSYVNIADSTSFDKSVKSPPYIK